MGEIVVTGQCKLCLKPATTLKDSHYIPKGVYKRLRDKNEKNPNPVVISKKTAVQTSRQETSHLLCSVCEQRFSKYGENWVLGHCLQEDGSFPLASILASRTPDVWSNTNPTRVYYASKISEINITALAYFAASIFWRGSVYGWNHDGSIPIRLGPFQEQFRQYLMGLKAFPKDCSLLVVVREGEEIDRLTYTPIGERKGNFHVHKFPMPGLGFTLAVSKNLPSNYRQMCFVHGSGNPVIVTPLIEEFLKDEAVKMVREIRFGRNKASPR
jgi:hypothetical protein